jgi:glycosyltransferase involved in cell wall biosynthesis
LLGLLTGKPVVCTLHGHVDLDPRERFKRIKFGLINRGASRVVFVSQSLKRFFLGTGLLRPGIATVIPNGVDLARFQRSPDLGARRKFGASPGDFLVGAVGNVRPAKGYDVFIQTAGLLNARSSTYRFAVVGEADSELGGALHSLREQVGVTESFAFPGFSDDIPTAMTAFDLFVITSRTEGFSIATIEAMASGLPIVATRCGGPEEILEDGVTGVLVENGSAEAIAEAIEALRTDPRRRRRLGDAARADVRERYGLERQVEAYEALYHKCLVGQLSRLA